MVSLRLIVDLAVYLSVQSGREEANFWAIVEHDFYSCLFYIVGYCHGKGTNNILVLLNES